MSELDIYLIQLTQDSERQFSVEEEKISSSSGRIRLLGTRLSPGLREWIRDSGPYIIGLTGGSASGKSSVGKKLESIHDFQNVLISILTMVILALGWGVVDCDKLGHLAYSPGEQ